MCLSDRVTQDVPMTNICIEIWVYAFYMLNVAYVTDDVK